MSVRLNEMHVNITIIKKNNIESCLKDTFINDGDLNGDNGKEYTSEECIDRGFECDLDMFVEDAMKNDSIEERINYMLKVVKGSSSYYDTLTHEIAEIDDNTYVVATAYAR